MRAPAAAPPLPIRQFAITPPETQMSSSKKQHAKTKTIRAPLRRLVPGEPSVTLTIRYYKVLLLRDLLRCAYKFKELMARRKRGTNIVIWAVKRKPWGVGVVIAKFYYVFETRGAL